MLRDSPLPRRVRIAALEVKLKDGVKLEGGIGNESAIPLRSEKIAPIEVMHDDITYGVVFFACVPLAGSETCDGTSGTKIPWIT